MDTRAKEALVPECFRRCDLLTLSIRFVPRVPSKCHLKRKMRGWTRGVRARRGFAARAAALEEVGSEGSGCWIELVGQGCISMIHTRYVVDSHCL